MLFRSVREKMQSMRFIYTGSFGVSGSGRVGSCTFTPWPSKFLFIFARKSIPLLVPIPFSTESKERFSAMERQDRLWPHEK